MEHEGKRKRRSREDLLKAGLNILARHGEGALTIESLCKRLNVTKGSFYHHFGSKDDFRRHLLDYWAREHTWRFIEFCDREDSAEERYRNLDAVSQETDDDVEVAVRTWAQRDPQAREYQERIDRMRIEYLEKLYSEMLGGSERASVFALLEYAAFVGSRQIMPGLDKARIRELLGLWTEMLKPYLKEGRDETA
ncbi:TetR family transcriptional regulator [Pseudodesulfovibrio cashew]|uniref:TetR family transcriptional regulator n=1 Tax=Pseudodesulfovibrio cashew TaxID=2678688 RepID=A0A6I6JEZ5_9BACT|nr:TetR/AcrR family transcriptional regulator [Pseudodesulfovibrio cashew]QGY39103.1 TetR family transcriptional regulator [Pseudodesulfovibrio cashew]